MHVHLLLQLVRKLDHTLRLHLRQSIHLDVRFEKDALRRYTRDSWRNSCWTPILSKILGLSKIWGFDYFFKTTAAKKPVFLVRRTSYPANIMVSIVSLPKFCHLGV